MIRSSFTSQCKQDKASRPHGMCLEKSEFLCNLCIIILPIFGFFFLFRTNIVWHTPPPLRRLCRFVLPQLVYKGNLTETKVCGMLLFPPCCTTTHKQTFFTFHACLFFFFLSLCLFVTLDISGSPRFDLSFGVTRLAYQLMPACMHTWVE